MQELIALVFGQFVVSLFMSLAALCLFLWAAASGQFEDVERVKYQVLETEGIEHDDRR